MSNALAELFKHNLWANLQLLDTCEKLSDEQLDATFPGTYGTICNTLLHVLGAEELYVNLLLGKPRGPRRQSEGFRGFDHLRTIVTNSGQALIDLTENNELPEVCHDLQPNGETEELAGTMLVIQAINHATEHRAHINSILSHLSIEPCDFDGWAYGYTHDMIKITKQG